MPSERTVSAATTHSGRRRGTSERVVITRPRPCVAFRSRARGSRARGGSRPCARQGAAGTRGGGGRVLASETGDPAGGRRPPPGGGAPPPAPRGGRTGVRKTPPPRLVGTPAPARPP